MKVVAVITLLAVDTKMLFGFVKIPDFAGPNRVTLSSPRAKQEPEGSSARDYPTMLSVLPSRLIAKSLKNGAPDRIRNCDPSQGGQRSSRISSDAWRIYTAISIVCKVWRDGLNRLKLLA
jgi:hypothetical protein